MAFPTSPTNGQTTTVNGITYVYNSTRNAWKRQTLVDLQLTGNVTAGRFLGTSASLSGNVTADYFLGTSASLSGNVTAGYFLGNGALLTGIVSGGGGGYGNTEVTANLTTGFYGNIIPSANLTYDIGSNTAWWGTFYGVSTQAKYADLAENYVSDAAYEPGTVLVFGGPCEVTATTATHDTAVAGVVSTHPAYLMNAESGNVSVALTGRVPCQVRGPVSKGTLLVTSNMLGVAEAINSSMYKPGCVIGKSLEAIDDNSVKTIEIAVGRF
jgi:hypothetical protein